MSSSETGNSMLFGILEKKGNAYMLAQVLDSGIVVPFQPPVRPTVMHYLQTEFVPGRGGLLVPVGEEPPFVDERDLQFAHALAKALYGVSVEGLHGGLG